MLCIFGFDVLGTVLWQGTYIFVDDFQFLAAEARVVISVDVGTFFYDCVLDEPSELFCSSWAMLHAKVK